MAFTDKTKVFTDRGWKLVGELSGRDRVLVRNFIGDAEFTQPFALKRAWYSGDVYRFGNQEWEIGVTPDHKMVYNEYNHKIGTKPADSTAKDVQPSRSVSLYRSFRYNQEPNPYERVEIKNKDFSWFVSISMEDWYTVLAYTMLCAYVDKRKNPHIMYVSDNLKPLTDIFDRLGVEWTQSAKKLGAPQIFVRNNSNLVSKLLHQVGARERRDMRLADRHVFGASAALLKHFVSVILSLNGTPVKNRPGAYDFTTVNEKLIKNLEIICLLAGFGMIITGRERGIQVRMTLNPPTSRIVTWVEKTEYLGYTYEIDLFDGLVYVMENKAPVWMAAK